MQASDTQARQGRLREMAVAEATEWMDSAIAQHKRELVELERYRARFVEVSKPEQMSTLVSPVEALSWFVNQMSQNGSNARLDLAVNRAAALALTQPGALARMAQS